MGLILVAFCATLKLCWLPAQWLDDRRAELLDTHYFHVVFTVPQEIEAIAFQNQVVVYDILFRAASETLRRIAADPEHLGAEIVGGVSVHQPPQTFDRVEMWRVGWNEVELNSAL